MMLAILFSRQWWKTTLLVLAAVLVMARLGIWQLDRLDQRREFNARVQAQLEQPPLELFGQNLDQDLYEMEYRAVLARGEYDHEREVVLRNQDWEGRLGVHILTPLIINGGEAAVLVDRGWVPYEDYTEGNLDRYQENSQVQVEGIIRRSQSKPAIGGQTDQVPEQGEEPLEAWYWINISDISRQIPYQLLPVYLSAVPGSSPGELPYRSQPELDLSEGSHLGYAFQWFIFAAILGIGYPIYVRREEMRAADAGEVDKPYVQSNLKAASSSEVENKGYKKA